MNNTDAVVEAFARAAAEATPTPAEPTDSGNVSRGAIAALRDNQRQLDMDGCEVGVSRQALDELLAGYDAAEAKVAALTEALTIIARKTSAVFGHGKMGGEEAAGVARAALASNEGGLR